MIIHLKGYDLIVRDVGEDRRGHIVIDSLPAVAYSMENVKVTKSYQVHEASRDLIIFVLSSSCSFPRLSVSFTWWIVVVVFKL